MGQGFGVSEIGKTTHKSPDVDLQDETDEIKINVNLEEEEYTYGYEAVYCSMGIVNAMLMLN